MERTAIYYNVLTGSLSLLGKPDSYFTDPATPNFKKSPRWFTKESNPSFYQPHILVSGPHNRKKDVCKDIHVGTDTTVFGDSGGFQLATEVINEKNWNRQIALEWSEKNVDIFPILDLPVAGKATSSGKKNVDDSLAYTVESAKYYADNRSVEGKTILNVLQSASASSFESWYNAVKDFPFDGWAFGGHANDIRTILSGILFLADKGEFDHDKVRPLHIFGTTSMGVIPYIVYAQHLLNEMGLNIQLSFDSSSASAMVNYGNFIQFCTPEAMVTTTVSNKYDWSKLNEYSRFGCDCPLCRDVTDISYMFSEEGKGQFYTIIALHNFYKMLSYKRTFDGIVSLNCDGVFESLPRKLKHNFKFMKKAFDLRGKAGLIVLQQGGEFLARSKGTVKSGSSTSIHKIV